MKNLKYISLMILGLFLLNSCSESLEDLNQDPGRLAEVDLRLMLPEAITQSLFNEGSNPARVSGLIMKQFQGLDAQQIDYGLYRLSENAMDNFWQTGLYSGSLRACQAIIDKATEAGNAEFYIAVSKIIMANQYGIATSYFGDMPMSEALQGTVVLQPSYDSQEAVYTAVQAMLDEGISELNALIASSSDGGYGGGDLIFGGDIASWVSTANALKARFYMHTSKRNAGDLANAMTALSGAFTSADNEPALQFEASQIANHALAKFGTERPGTLGFHPEFAAMLGDDPRAAAYYVDGTFEYWGSDQLVWAQNDATLPMISFVELKMIQAEIMTRNGADASSVLQEAISASMAKVGADDVDDAYAIANSDLSGLSTEAALEKIMTEAYKAYYGFNFHETWSNYRRTGYPNIQPEDSDGNGLNPGKQIPRRFLYGDSESATNSANYEAAVDAQGGALLNVDVWAFQ